MCVIRREIRESRERNPIKEEARRRLVLREKERKSHKNILQSRFMLSTRAAVTYTERR
jgi:hypothetical protein